MVDTVFGIKVRMSGLCINRYRPIIGRLLDADYRRPIISKFYMLGLSFTWSHFTSKCILYTASGACHTVDLINWKQFVFKRLYLFVVICCLLLLLGICHITYDLCSLSL